MIGELTKTWKAVTPPVLKEATRSSIRWAAARTSTLRPLPDFLVIGTKRGGTTSLWRYLLDHPMVLPMVPKAETLKSTHYFEEHYTKGLDWYRGHFPTAAYRRSLERRLGGPTVVGEASPLYLWHPLVAQRVCDVLPAAKVIVLLRNPVDRAYSHYRERVGQGVEPLSFEAALEAEDRRLAGEVEQLSADPAYHSHAYDSYAYRSRGVYRPQLDRWLALFPREQVLILRSEDLYADAQHVVDQVTAFLGLPQFPLAEFERHNQLPSAPMSPRTRAALCDFYRSHNERLYELVGRDFGWDRP